MDKEKFFKNDYVKILSQLKGDETPAWGKFSAHGMIEHMTESIGMGWGRVISEMQTPPQFLEKAKSFAMSDKEFKPNTPNSILGETPAALRKNNISDALNELQNEINSFIDYHNANASLTITNPFFGDLNYAEWLHLLHKHAIHHLKQFNCA